ncbi:hypothetical protein ACFLXY_08165 [Chloroflexota bacterium]
MYKLIVVLCLVILSTCLGCVTDTSRSSAPTQTENTTSNATVDELNNTISGDIIFLHDLAAKHSIVIRSIEHQGDTVIVELSADNSQQYEEYVNAINNSEHFLLDVKPPSNSTEINEGRIILQSYILTDTNRILEFANPRPMMSICIICGIIFNTLDNNGINPPNSHLDMSSAGETTYKVGLRTYNITPVEFSLVDGKKENILHFIVDLDTMSESIVLTKAVITEKNYEKGTPEIRLNIEFDYYDY